MSPSNERKEKSIKLGIDDNSKASLNSFERKKKRKFKLMKDQQNFD